MIIGNCPYCDQLLMLSIAPETPRLEKHLCEHCHRELWTVHSRFDPVTYTKERFLEIFEVDEENHKVWRRV